jgi:nucleotide-binding universal stress UspA family protein
VKTIIVGYDDTEPAKRALERAADLASAFGSHLIVTSVVPVVTSAAPRSIGTDPEDDEGTHTAQLAAAKTFLTGRGIEADYIEALGHPAEAIVDAAVERGADMIVVGTREPGFAQRLFGNSVSDGVAHRAHCDVLIVH